MQIQVKDKVFCLEPNWDEEIVIRLSESKSSIRIGTFGLRGLTVLLPELCTYASSPDSHQFTIFDDPLYPVGIELDMGKGGRLQLRRLEYLEEDETPRPAQIT